MAVKIANTGKLVIETSIDATSCDELMLRMEALIALIQMQNEDCNVHSEQYYALELLKDLLPTQEQITTYLATSATDSFN